jgi:hypothetical protein
MLNPSNSPITAEFLARPCLSQAVHPSGKADFMAASAYLAMLLQRHRLLDDELAEARGHPSVADFTLAELKRRKLRLKDQIARQTNLGGVGVPVLT